MRWTIFSLVFILKFNSKLDFIQIQIKKTVIWIWVYIANIFFLKHYNGVVKSNTKKNLYILNMFSIYSIDILIVKSEICMFLNLK